MKKHIALKQHCLSMHIEYLSRFQVNVLDTTLLGPMSNSTEDTPDSDSEQHEDMDIDLPPSPQLYQQSSPISMESQESADNVSDSDRYIEAFPGEGNAGAAVFDQRMKTPFENMKDSYLASGQGEYGPFASHEEWELAEWLVKNTGHNQINSLLKLRIVCT
jgi:hypothetical protein